MNAELLIRSLVSSFSILGYHMQAVSTHSLICFSMLLARVRPLFQEDLKTVLPSPGRVWTGAGIGQVAR